MDAHVINRTLYTFEGVRLGLSVRQTLRQDRTLTTSAQHRHLFLADQTGLCIMQPGDQVHDEDLNENDVLMGRGGHNFEHSGNEQLRNICRAKVPEYRRARKKLKSIISKAILTQIKGMDPPGRFLRKCCKTKTWKLAKDSVAREKVCQSLRDAVQEAQDLIESSSGEDDDEKVGGDIDDSQRCAYPPPPCPPPLRVASIDETTMISTRGTARRPVRVSPSEGLRSSRFTASSHDDTPSGFQAFNDVELLEFDHFDSWFDGHRSTEPHQEIFRL